MTLNQRTCPIVIGTRHGTPSESITIIFLMICTLETRYCFLLPDGGTLPGGPYPAYLNLEVDRDGAVTGEVHFACEPKYPAPIAVGAELTLHAPHPNSIVGDNVILKVKLVDDSGRSPDMFKVQQPSFGLIPRRTTVQLVRTMISCQCCGERCLIEI